MVNGHCLVYELWDKSKTVITYLLTTKNGGFHKWDTPEWMVYNGKFHSSVDDQQGYSHDSENKFCEDTKYLVFDVYTLLDVPLSKGHQLHDMDHCRKKRTSLLSHF